MSFSRADHMPVRLNWHAQTWKLVNYCWKCWLSTAVYQILISANCFWSLRFWFLVLMKFFLLNFVLATLFLPVCSFKLRHIQCPSFVESSESVNKIADLRGGSIDSFQIMQKICKVSVVWTGGFFFYLTYSPFNTFRLFYSTFLFTKYERKWLTYN